MKLRLTKLFFQSSHHPVSVLYSCGESWDYSYMCKKYCVFSCYCVPCTNRCM